MTFRRKYIDLPTELCASLAMNAAAQGISQRKYIEDAISARIALDSKAGKTKRGKRK